MNRENPAVELVVLIVSYNVSALLRKCLQSLNGRLPVISHKIIVVDNCSDDNSADMVREEFPACALLTTGENIGFGGANNLGAKEIEAQYYLVLNPDTEITNDIIVKMMDHIKAHPEAGVVGCRMLTSSGDIQRSIYALPGLVSTISGILQLKRMLDVKFLMRLFEWAFFIPVVKKYLHSHETATVWEKTESVPGSCFLVNGGVWRNLNGFDEKIFLYREDADLFYRIIHSGFEIHLLPELGVTHHVGKSFETKFTEMAPCKHWSTLYYFRKNHGLLSYLIVSGFLFFAASLKFLYAHFACFKDSSQKHRYMRDCVLVMKISLLGLDSFSPFPSKC